MAGAAPREAGHQPVADHLQGLHQQHQQHQLRRLLRPQHLHQHQQRQHLLRLTPS